MRKNKIYIIHPYFCSFFFSILLWGNFPSLHADSPIPIPPLKRIQAHLIIQDPQMAAEEAYKALQQEPSQLMLWREYIISLARLQEEKKMMAAWKSYEQLSPDPCKDEGLLEEMARCILLSGASSKSVLIRGIALSGAFTSGDMQGVRLLHRFMRDSNSHIRA